MIGLSEEENKNMHLLPPHPNLFILEKEFIVKSISAIELY